MPFSSKSKKPASTYVPSPCNDRCELDADQVCLGCGRTIDEIVNWGSVNNDLKTKIVLSAKARMKDKS